jgi:hypothetical protein
MWRWYRSGGFETIARWLADRDVSKFNPSAPPMWTEFKENLIENGMSMAESFILTQIRARTDEFRLGVVATPFYGICDRLMAVGPAGVKIPPSALLHALKEAGWIDRGRVASVEHPSRRHVFVAPEFAKERKTTLRNMLEPSSDGNVIGFPGRTA